ncbi:hypothetical protein [Methylobacterium sp. Leaf456]|uniref:hypothetical protein n=1 Tax=Methylobacterium sp. Leaf456 TaxID=1736382 RepID=UPI00138F32DC|nr:hypothetical protein [Methylobacterium sp. Leaf456]
MSEADSVTRVGPDADGLPVVVPEGFPSDGLAPMGGTALLPVGPGLAGLSGFRSPGLAAAVAGGTALLPVAPGFSGTAPPEVLAVAVPGVGEAATEDLAGSEGFGSEGLGAPPTGGTGLPTLPGFEGAADALDGALGVDPVDETDDVAPMGLMGSDGLAPTGGTALLPVAPDLSGSPVLASWGRPVPGEDGAPPGSALLPVGPGFTGSDFVKTGLPAWGVPAGAGVPGLGVEEEAGDAPLSAGFGPSLGEVTGVRSLRHL